MKSTNSPRLIIINFSKIILFSYSCIPVTFFLNKFNRNNCTKKKMANNHIYLLVILFEIENCHIDKLNMKFIRKYLN